ncbi:tetratricopeptide repeat protein [Acetobacteraceae bacterium H6797]|nr:tetratricopeptide repeat protein [Acetobacteraceae bacterium H6797]
MTSLLATALVLVPLAAAPAFAQMDSREGIALQNQILQLRQELDQLRRNAPSGGSAGGSSLGGAYVPPPSRGGAPAAGGGSELVAGLLDRVNNLEDEVRRLRGRAEEAEYKNKQLSDQLEKLNGDMDYRLQQLEGGGRSGGAAPTPAPGRPPASSSGSLTPPAGASPAAPAAAAPRTPEKALADGQAALGRRDYASAEAAAREVIASRNTARAQDAQLLLGQSLLGKRDFQNAAVAFDDAYRRNRQSARAPEAMIGLANSFLGFGAKKEACATLGDLRTEFPRLSGSLNQQAQETARRGGC